MESFNRILGKLLDFSPEFGGIRPAQLSLTPTWLFLSLTLSKLLPFIRRGRPNAVNLLIVHRFVLQRRVVIYSAHILKAVRLSPVANIFLFPDFLFLEARSIFVPRMPAVGDGYLRQAYFRINDGLKNVKKLHTMSKTDQTLTPSQEAGKMTRMRMTILGRKIFSFRRDLRLDKFNNWKVMCMR